MRFRLRTLFLMVSSAGIALALSAQTTEKARQLEEQFTNKNTNRFKFNTSDRLVELSNISCTYPTTIFDRICFRRRVFFKYDACFVSTDSSYSFSTYNCETSFHVWFAGHRTLEHREKWEGTSYWTFNLHRRIETVLKYLANVGQQCDSRESGLARVLNWGIADSGSVIANVIWLERTRY